MGNSGKSNGKKAGKYAEERFDPKTPHCAKSAVSITFNGENLSITVPGKKGATISYIAASGKADAHMKFDYGIERQKQSNIGPIPTGEYWITPAELWENAWYKFTSPSDAWGDYRIAIHPYPTTKTHGRGGFFIHGGMVLGSAGCIDLASNMNKFINDLMKALPGSQECYIPLSVKY